MTFTRKDLHKKKRLNPSWRKPKGLQNKMRLSRKGHNGKVRPGFGTENSKKNQYKGLDIVHVSKVDELKQYDPKKEALNLMKLSKKNKVELIKAAQKKGFIFVNFNAELYLKKLEEKQKELLKQKKSRSDKKESQKQKDTKKDSKTEEKTSSNEDESSKSEEKKQKDRVLTKSK